MAEAIPETIEKATHAVEVAAKPSIFPVLVALLALSGVGFLVWRDEVRADVQIEVLRQLSDSLRDVKLSLRERGVEVTHHAPPPRVQASGLGGVDE